jgi:hypothetical protein
MSKLKKGPLKSIAQYLEETKHPGNVYKPLKSYSVPTLPLNRLNALKPNTKRIGQSSKQPGSNGKLNRIIHTLGHTNGNTNGNTNDNTNGGKRKTYKRKTRKHYVRKH